MELIGPDTRKWAGERWKELLDRLPNLNADRMDALIDALGGLSEGARALASFLCPRTADPGRLEFSEDLGELLMECERIDVNEVVKADHEALERLTRIRKLVEKVTTQEDPYWHVRARPRAREPEPVCVKCEGPVSPNPQDGLCEECLLERMKGTKPR
jgi:hypothetical protein